jgi:hypothetical protein
VEEEEEESCVVESRMTDSMWIEYNVIFCFGRSDYMYTMWHNLYLVSEETQRK